MVEHEAKQVYSTFRQDYTSLALIKASLSNNDSDHSARISLRAAATSHLISLKSIYFLTSSPELLKAPAQINHKT